MSGMGLDPTRSRSKPHAVCIPHPAQGHMTPMMQLAKLLHSRGFHVTFVNTEFNHGRILASYGPDAVRGLADFRFRAIPDGLPPPERGDANQDIPALCDSTRKNCLGPFRELLAELNSSRDVPPVTCIVSDGVMSFATKAAEEIGVAEAQFWTASASSFMAYLQFHELLRRGILKFQDDKLITEHSLDTPIDWIPGMRNLRLKDIPNFFRTTNPRLMFNFMADEAHNCLKAPSIIFNTFHALEHEVLEEIASKFPHTYTTGPLSLLQQHMISDTQLKSLKLSLLKEDSECIEWLDKQEPSSVVYVNYGSVSVMTGQDLVELAWGLANSKHAFLWIVRPDVVMGDSTVLPGEFYEEIKDRGLLKSWCPQEQVLRHGAVGVFLTHCGWNSVLESMCGGVPLICWPFFADQQTNRRYACDEWGIGVEMNCDAVKRCEIEGFVRTVMEGDEGKKMRSKAEEWKKKAEEAVDVGESSYRDFDRFIKEALRCEH